MHEQCLYSSGGSEFLSIAQVREPCIIVTESSWEGRQVPQPSQPLPETGRVACSVRRVWAPVFLVIAMNTLEDTLPPNGTVRCL